MGTLTEMWLVDADHLRRLQVRIRQIAARTNQVLEDTELIARTMEKLTDEISKEMERVPAAQGLLRASLEKRLEIGPRLSYADVVSRLVAEPIFSLDEAYETIHDLISTDSTRVRDGLRQSLDRDSRFSRMAVDEDETIWYERINSEEFAPT